MTDLEIGMTDLGNDTNSSKIDGDFSCQPGLHQQKRYMRSRPTPKFYIKMKNHIAENPYLSIVLFY